MRITDINPKDPALEGCMATVSGRVIDLFNPNPEDIILSDIAHGLAFNCRWNGHTKGFYSVAEHCCRMHDFAPDEIKALALFHDCEEAYWGDIIRPLKMILKTMAPEIIIKMKDTRLYILSKYGIEYKKEIEMFDNVELTWEFDNLILKQKHTPLTSEEAKKQWLDRALLYC